jgi:hypothetical protein
LQYVTGCRRLIKQLGLQDNVTLHGLGNPQKVRPAAQGPRGGPAAARRLS